MIVGIIEDRDCIASESHINRSDIIGGSLNSGSCLDIIGRAHNNHSGDRAHQRQIFVALMARSILTYRDSGMRCADLDIEVRITDRISDLLISTPCCKHCKGGRKRGLACCRKSCRNRHHIALCDSAVIKTLRVFFCKIRGSCGGLQVRIQNNDFRMIRTELLQCVSVALTGCDLLNVCHYCSPSFSSSASIASSSFIASAYCSSFGAVPCQDA